MTAQSKLDIVFLGSSGAITIPAFFCDCATCETARKDPKQQRTRASVALLGKETTLIDAGPDLEFQLEREGIRRMDNIFITHWHYDHVWGLGALGEPANIGDWPLIQVYGTDDVLAHFDSDVRYMRRVVEMHSIKTGDVIKLPDATWRVVKTTHTDDSVGFVVDSGKKFAYLVDGIVPPPETIEHLHDVDMLILEATMDFLDEEWKSFTMKDAIEFWIEMGTPECILTHLSCHGWKDEKLVAGITPQERQEVEERNKGLKFAYDGMRIRFG
ncbi:MAG: MBL fold metallo-hydrolase [Candidatus Thorarchaeota archaeon]|jgi:phosphoribosyl 1,2-cyclic phosphate phosphodiesterase